MWEKGRFIINGLPFMYEAKVFGKPSELGINNGRVSKLEVVHDLGDDRWHSDFMIILYDRGWVYKMDDPITDRVLNYILRLYA